MEDIESKQKELLLDLDEEMDWDSGLRECPSVDAAAMTEMPDYVKERLEELLADYISDENNYVVEGASVTCDQMSNKPVQMYYWNGKLGIKGEGGSAEINYDLPENGVSLPCIELDSNEIEIGRFHAINSKQHANGLRFATISDRSCLRDKIEKENMKEGKDVANLISMGNCKIMRDSDVLEINKRKGRAKIYGTCYCLMKPDTQWVNPMCMESLMENSDNEQEDEEQCSHDEHHHTMNWNTEGGQEEGLTRLSTLLCTRGGIITFTWSGQSVQENSEEAKEKDPDNILSEDEILFIATIYGEGGICNEKTWQALAHATVNRFGVREWREYTSVADIIKHSGFDAYGGENYLDAQEYLRNRDYSNEKIERMIDVVLPIYRGEEEDITNNAVFFYSPEAQKQLHEKDPSTYRETPDYVNDKTEEVFISGTEKFKFYKYKE